MSLKARLKKVETASQKLKKPVKGVISQDSDEYISLISSCAFGYWESCLKYAKGVDKREHDALWNCENEAVKEDKLQSFQDMQPKKTIIKDLGARYDFEVFNDNVQKAYSYLDEIEKGELVDPPEIEDILEMPELLFAFWPVDEERSNYKKRWNL